MKFGAYLILIFSAFAFILSGYKLFLVYTHPLKYKEEIEEYSRIYDLPSDLIASVINVESSFDEKAKSSYKSAYEYFLDKKYDDCVRHTCLALESAIRTVLQKKGIALSEKDGLSKFIDLLFDNKVIPMEHSDFASGLKNVFKEIPKFKNKNSGHGLSEFDKRKTSEAKAKLVLNLAATLITFMAEID